MPATVRRERARRWNLAYAVAVELLIVAIAAAVYVVVREFTEGTPERALANARDLVAFERAVGIHHEAWVQAFVLEHGWLRTAANWIYIWGHWPVITCVAVGLWFTRRDNYVRLRNAVFASGLIGFLLFALVPMAPPRLTDLGYVDTVTVWSRSYRVLQPPHYTNLYAAMPSLHFGWDLLVGLTLFASTRNVALRAFGLAMPVAMGFAVIATGNHWFLDVIVALLVVAAGAAIAFAVERVGHGQRGRDVRAARDRAPFPAARRPGGASQAGSHAGRVAAVREPSA